MDNLELRLVKLCIPGFFIVLGLVLSVLEYKKNKSKRRKHLKKVRITNITQIILFSILFSFCTYLIGCVGLDIVFKDHETKNLVFSEISHNGSRSDLFWGYAIVFEDDFRCYTYGPSKKYDYLESNGNGTVYKVTYGKRSHLLVSIEDIL